MKIHVTDQKGETRSLKAVKGWRIMEVIRDANLPMKAECGGACACATCHVYVDPEWLSKVGESDSLELAMLDEAFEVEDNSRLCCQITMDASLDGLCLTLAPGIEPD